MLATGGTVNEILGKSGRFAEKVFISVNANPSVIDDSAVLRARKYISAIDVRHVKTAASKNHSAIFQPPRHTIFLWRSFAVSSAREFAFEART